MVTLLFQTKQTNLVFDWHGLGLFISIFLTHKVNFQTQQHSSVVWFDKKMASLNLNSPPSKIYSIWENLLWMFWMILCLSTWDFIKEMAHIICKTILDHLLQLSFDIQGNKEYLTYMFLYVLNIFTNISGMNMVFLDVFQRCF